MNQNKKCEVCESYRGNPPPHVCPQAASPEESQEKAIKTVERLDHSCKDGCVHSPASSDWKEKERGEFYKSEGPRFTVGGTDISLRRIADWWLSRIETLFQEFYDEQNRISNSGRKLYQFGEKAGWKEGQLHGEAVGRKAERDRLIALAEGLKHTHDCKRAKCKKDFNQALLDFITQAKTNEN